MEDKLRDQELRTQVHYRLVEELSASEERYRTLVEGLRDVVFRASTTGVVVFINPAWKRLLGHDQGDIHGTDLGDWFDPREEGASKSWRAWCAANQADPWSATVRFLSASNETRWMVVWARRDAEGAVFGSMTDVTETRRIQDLKASFVSAVSHELRTPLTSILGFTKTLLRAEGLSEAQKSEFLRIIHEQSSHLTSLIEGILDLSHLDHGVVELQLEKLNPIRLLQEAARQAQSRFPDIRIEMYTPHLPFMVTADGIRIRLILDNLLMNAAKFSRSQGTIRVTMGVAGEEWFIEVEDGGVGIDSIHHERIFERFYRIPQAGKIIPGTGLGLALVEECASLHGGRVTLDSSVGKGARFRVVLPRSA